MKQHAKGSISKLKDFLYSPQFALDFYLCSKKNIYMYLITFICFATVHFMKSTATTPKPNIDIFPKSESPACFGFLPYLVNTHDLIMYYVFSKSQFLINCSLSDLLWSIQSTVQVRFTY